MSSQPLQRVNFVDSAYDAIKELIVSDELPPGTQLKIEALSQRLGVSNSPIREALRRLENERWIETIPFRGAFVRPFDEPELIELYEVREVIELAALRKVMPEPSPDHLERLGQALREIRVALRSGDQMGYLAADMRFHQVLVDMAGNRRLSAWYATLAEQGRCFVLGRNREAMARSKQGREQHAELFEAIRDGRTERALQLLALHLKVGLDDLRQRAETNQG